MFLNKQNYNIVMHSIVAGLRKGRVFTNLNKK